MNLKRVVRPWSFCGGRARLRHRPRVASLSLQRLLLPHGLWPVRCDPGPRLPSWTWCARSVDAGSRCPAVRPGFQTSDPELCLVPLHFPCGCVSPRRASDWSHQRLHLFPSSLFPGDFSFLHLLHSGLLCPGYPFTGTVCNKIVSFRVSILYLLCGGLGPLVSHGSSGAW